MSRKLDRLRFETKHEGAVNKVNVDEEVAMDAFKAYFEAEIGRYIEHQYHLTNKKIEEKILDMEKRLNQYVNDKFKDISERIADELLSDKVRENINNKINEKLSKFAELIKEDIKK